MAQQSISVANGETQSKIYDVVKDGVIGLVPNDMQKIVVAIPAANNTVVFTFTEPSDTIIDGQTICNVRGVRVVMKEGSAPQNENDGVLVLENEELGKYSSNQYEVTGLDNDKAYYFGFFPYSDHFVFNRNPKNVREISLTHHTLYGFKIDKNDPNPDTRITYLEDAIGMTPAHMDLELGQFDYGDWNPSTTFFLRNNKPFMVNYDGTPAYELDENDYTKKLDGTDSDVANTSFAGNAMAKMETVWLYQYEDEQYEYCYVCNIKLDDDYHAYAHERADGSVMSYIWLSLFDASVDANGKYRSIKGRSILSTYSKSTLSDHITDYGGLWYTRTWAQRNLINMLLYLMFKSDNLQTALGPGFSRTIEGDRSNLLLPGGAFNKGRFYGSTVDRDYIKVFHIENWWGNLMEQLAGAVYKNKKLFVKMTPPYNLNGDNYEDTGIVIDSTTTIGYIKQTNMSQYGRMPVSCTDGSATTYACDGLLHNNSVTGTSYCLAVGGHGSWSSQCGPLCTDCRITAENTSSDVIIGLSCEEPLSETTVQ